MATYLIADVEVTDLAAMGEYFKLADESLAPFQWKQIICCGVVEVIEGDWKPKNLAILEFESVEQAQQWYQSPAYSEAKNIRLRAASSNVILVEGV